MLKQHYRFHGHGSLKYVYKNGKAIRSRQVTLKYVGNDRRARSRCSVVVSKKVLKSAVGRNRIRRRIYEILRLQIPNFSANYDIVYLVFSSDVATMPAPELENLIIEQLKEADIIK